MRRAVLLGLVVMLMLFGWIAFELVTEPRDIDVSNCETRWRDGRIISVTCPGGPPG